MRVNNAVTFVIRPNMAVKLHGVNAPTPGTPKAASAKEYLESLILKKKVEFETLEWDRLGRSIATVKAGDVDVNESMKKFLEG